MDVDIWPYWNEGHSKTLQIRFSKILFVVIFIENLLADNLYWNLFDGTLMMLLKLVTED